MGLGLLAPRAARAQSKTKIPTIGVLWHAGSAEEEAIYLGAFEDGLKSLGYVDGRSVRLVQRFPNEQPERFIRHAAELAALDVDILVAVTRPAALAAQRATATIPIVFIVVADPSFCIGVIIRKPLPRNPSRGKRPRIVGRFISIAPKPDPFKIAAARIHRIKGLPSARAPFCLADFDQMVSKVSVTALE